MANADAAFSGLALAKETGIIITGRLKYIPVIFAEATPEQVAELAKNQDIKKITFDGMMHALEPTTGSFLEPDEELWIQMTESLVLINAQAAWSDGWRGQGIKMAVLDTGIWEAHPWLVGKTVGRWSGYGDNPATPIHPHGTHCAGICTKVAPEAKLLNIKVLSDQGSGSFATIMQGIETAADLGANIMSMSFGALIPVCGDNDPFDDLIKTLSANIIFCCAAGNSGPWIGTIDYPGSSRSVICCGAVDKSKVIADFSGRGPSKCAEIKPDAVAPGVAIVSSIPPDQTASYNGTSMATPMFAGMFACVRSKGFISVRSDLEKLLEASIPHSAKNNIYGYGLIDVKAACDYLETVPEPPAPPTPSPQTGDTHYTNYSLVRKRAAQISSTLTNDDLDVFIRAAEGLIDTIMKDNFRENFNPATHGLIRETCEAMAAYSALAYDITQFSANPQAALEADMLNNVIERNFELLKDPRTVQILKSLPHLSPSSTSYADYSLVRKRIARISTALTDADISEFIFQAEGIIDSIMKESFRDNSGGSFKPSQHGLIQETCEAMAAYSCINYDVTQFASVSQASLAANLLWKIIERNFELLRDPRNIAQMKAM